MVNVELGIAPRSGPYAETKTVDVVTVAATIGRDAMRLAGGAHTWMQSKKCPMVFGVVCDDVVVVGWKFGMVVLAPDEYRMVRAVSYRMTGQTYYDAFCDAKSVVAIVEETGFVARGKGEESWL